MSPTVLQGISRPPIDFPVVLPHRKLDEEYKERIAALKNELRQEREQILQQVGKQRVELEQEIEKAKTEENYIRDRLALSLKVIFLVALWPGSMLGIYSEHCSSLRAQVCIGLNPRILPGHGLDMVVASGSGVWTVLRGV